MKQLIITVALMVFFAGCNNGQTNKNQEKKMKKLNSLEWAEAVYAIYDDCITELDGLVGEKPEPDAALKEKVETLKVSVISRLLPLGAMRAEMAESDQKSASAQLGSKMIGISKNPGWGRTQNDARIHYAKSDPGLAALIASFNIITQYAQYELLKKQEPAEAERLGLN